MMYNVFRNVELYGSGTAIKQVDTHILLMCDNCFSGYIGQHFCMKKLLLTLAGSRTRDLQNYL